MQYEVRMLTPLRRDEFGWSEHLERRKTKNSKKLKIKSKHDRRV